MKFSIFKKIWFKSEFSKNVLTIMTGNGIAQIIPILISPVLSRIYSPKDFGIFGLYLSISSLLSIIATGRYEMAIMLPKKQNEVNAIVKLILIILSFVTCFTIFVIIAYSDKIAMLFNNIELSKYLFLLPISVVLISLTQLMNYILIRDNKFKLLAKNTVLNVISNYSAQLGIGIFKGSPIGLIIGRIFGFLVAILSVVKGGHLKHIFSLRGITTKKVMIKYRNFPMFDLPSTLLNTFAIQMPIIAFSKYFTMSITGHYSFMNRIFQMPINLLSRSVLDVFKQRATSDYNSYGNCHAIYIKTLKSLVIMCILPMLILMTCAPLLFRILFGPEWTTAGEYAQILTPMMMLKFIVSPLSYVFYIVQKQKYDLYGQIAFLITSLLSIIVGVYFNNIKILLILYSATSICIYSFYLILSYFYSKGLNSVKNNYQVINA